MTPATDLPHERFQSLFNLHRGIVCKVAFSYCRSPEDRLDLEQEIALQVWRAYQRYDPGRPFATWLYRIALNVAISAVRDSARRPRAVPLDERTVGEEPSSSEDDRLGVLRRFMGQLDHMNRALLMLYLDDHSYRDIADVLGISETNVATKLHRLKQRLRDAAKS